MQRCEERAVTVASYKPYFVEGKNLLCKLRGYPYRQADMFSFLFFKPKHWQQFFCVASQFHPQHFQLKLTPFFFSSQESAFYTTPCYFNIFLLCCITIPSTTFSTKTDTILFQLTRICLLYSMPFQHFSVILINNLSPRRQTTGKFTKLI